MLNVSYQYGTNDITAHQLRHLHVGWPNPPAPETFLESLRNMNAVVLAIDAQTDDVVGFVCGMTDGVLMLYVWDLEVLPDFHDNGIEEALLQELLGRYGDIYTVNANPHPGTQPYFEQAGFQVLRSDQCHAMTRMNMAWQDGGPRAVLSG